MARKREENTQAEVAGESATPEFAAANEQAAQREEVQAAVRDGDVVLDTDATNENQDTEAATAEISVEEAVAANAARRAKGEESVTEGVADDNPFEGYGATARIEDLPEDEQAVQKGEIGEDTMAVRQSFVDRVVDGEIVRASADGSPDAGRGTA